MLRPQQTFRQQQQSKSLYGLNQWLIAFVFIFISFLVATVVLLAVFHDSSSSSVVVTEIDMVQDLSNAINDTAALNNLINTFARTITQQDYQTNVDLFIPGSQIDFHRSFVYLTGAALSLTQWATQLAVFAGGLSSNHLLITNCNITQPTMNTAYIRCIALYSYTYKYSLSILTSSYATEDVVFQPAFNASRTTIGWRFTYAIAQINSTKTLLSSIDTGVTPPGAIVTRRATKRDPASTWNIILAQIASLLVRGELQTINAICKTEQYTTLAATFNTYGNLTCDTFVPPTSYVTTPVICSGSGFIDSSCIVGNVSSVIPDRIATINTIEPYPSIPATAGSLDFSITGGVGIEVTGGIHGITINNIGLAAITLNGNAEHYFTKTGLPFPSITMNTFPQPPNIVWAGPSSGVSFATPVFRYLVINDLPLIDLSSAPILTGVLPVSLGGTGTNVTLLLGEFLVRGPSGGYEPGTLVPGDGITITLDGASFVISTNLNDSDLGLALSVPEDLFSPLTTQLIQNGTLGFTVQPQLARTFWAGPSSGLPDEPSFRYIEMDDIVNGTLPIERGGTGNGGPYSGNMLIFSAPDGLSFVEGSLIAGQGINISPFNEITAIINITLAVPTDIFYLTSGPISNYETLSFDVLPQAAHTVWAGPTSGSPDVPSFRTIVMSDLPLINLAQTTGVLDVSHGGTGNGGPYAGNAIIVSSLDGSQLIEGSLVEGSGITIDNNFTLSITGLCTGADKLSQTCLNLDSFSCTTPMNANCIPLTLPSLTINSLNVATTTFLGTETQCINPISNSCLDISQQSCPNGPLSQTCLPLEATFASVTTSELILLGTNITFANVIQTEAINTTEVFTESLTLAHSLICTAPGNQIASDCFSLVNKTCTGGHIDSSCISENQFLLNVGVSNTLTINNLVCTGPLIPTSCLPVMVSTINLIEPDSMNDFSILHGTGIEILSTTNGITIVNTGVTSVSLSLPPEFSVTTPTVTTTGTLTAASYVSQLQNLVFASPSGSSGTPSFRALGTLDLPTLSPYTIYMGESLGSGTTEVTLTSGTGISILESSGNLYISNTGVTSVSLSLPGSVFSVTTPTVTTTGTLTAAFTTQQPNYIFAGPAVGVTPGAPTFRAQVIADLPYLNASEFYVGDSSGSGVVIGSFLAGTGVDISQTGGGVITIDNTGVTSVSLSLPASLFTVTIPTVTTTGTLTATLVSNAANMFFATPISGSGVPSFRTFDIYDLPSTAMGTVFIGQGAGLPQVSSQLTAGTLISITPGVGTITVGTSALGTVSITVPSFLSVAATPGPNTVSFGITLVTEASNTIFAGPTTGAADAPTFRTQVLADLPQLTNGQLYIGSTGSSVVSATLTGTAHQINVVNGAGTITLSLPQSIHTGAAPSFSTMTLNSPTNQLVLGNTNTATISASAPAASRTYTIADPGASANFVMDTTGPLVISGTPVAGQVLTASSGAAASWATPSTGNGTVTSVALSSLSPLWSTVTGSPVTLSGTLTPVLSTQSANVFFAGPTTGAAAAPTFRTHVLADLPQLTNGQLYIGSTGSSVVAATLTGTTNQVVITNGAGTITLSLPQNIHTSATPVFVSMTLTSATNQLVLGNTNTATISASAPAASRTYTIADPGASANFVMDTAGNLVISGTPTAGQVLTATNGTAANWQTPSSASTTITIIKSVTSKATASVSITNAYVTLNSVSLTSNGTWQCLFEAILFNTIGGGNSTISVEYEIATVSGTDLDNSYRNVGDNQDFIILTSAEVVVTSAPQTVFVEWRNSGGSGTLGRYVTKSGTGRSLRCWKSS